MINATFHDPTGATTNLLSTDTVIINIEDKDHNELSIFIHTIEEAQKIADAANAALALLRMHQKGETE